jgi:HD-GYP domain-containing protein (c-di-GMP phosphodiesterase class II)
MIGVGEGDPGSGVRLAELVAAFSLATDLGMGQPMEHVLRSWLIAVRLGERLGMDAEAQVALYYVMVLAWTGCVADTAEVAAWFGDDIAFRGDSYRVDLAGLPLMGFALSHVGAGTPLLHRLRLAANLVLTGGRAIERGLMSHCLSTTQLATRLGLAAEVCDPLQQVFTRWDATGVPAGVGGEQIAPPVRLFHLADIVEVFHRAGGVEAAVEVARSRRGKQFDPEVVDLFCGAARDVLADLDAEAELGALIEAAPGLRQPLSERELDSALEAVADFTDLRSPARAGHSRAVADLAATAAQLCGLPEQEIVTLRRAALVHDVGMHGVPASILDKRGPLSGAEMERMRLHSYWTERVLARPPALARIGAVASLASERLDGSGHHRGLSGPAIPATGRILAAADVCRAMTEPRPYRPARSPQQAADELRNEVRSGHLAADAVDAVLAAAGQRGKRRAGPAGLTPREVEVLTLIARGASTRQVADTLGITAKTAETHIERIYTKTGASTRTTATLFAVQHGLLDSLIPLDLSGKPPTTPDAATPSLLLTGPAQARA